LARSNLEKYPPRRQQLDLAGVLDLIANWSRSLETSTKDAAGLVIENPLRLALRRTWTTLFVEGRV